MKTTYYIILSIIFSILFFSCGEMDEIYQEYVVADGIIYPGKATSPLVSAGKGRVQVSWLGGTDPKVVRAKIYWNNYTDSVELTIPENADTIRYIVEGLEENTYTFIIKTYDANDNVSIPVEVSGRTYGHLFQSSLFNRNISNVVVSEDDGWIIEWKTGDISKGAVFSEVLYIDSKGVEQISIVPIDDMTSTIHDFRGGTEYRYRTAYLPEEGAIDIFYTDYNVLKIPPLKVKKDRWIVTASSDARDSQAPNGAPQMVIDDNPNTFWHSQHRPSSPGYPHWIAVDMKNEIEVEYVELTPRSSYPEQSFNQFTIQGSMDGENWTNLGDFNLEPVGLKVQKFVLEGNPTMRHMRIYMTRGGTVHAHLAEFSVFGSYAN